jgi:hypothetical protein
MTLKYVIKNGEVLDVVESENLIDFIVGLLETGEYDPKVDKLKVLSQEDWQRKARSRLNR